MVMESCTLTVQVIMEWVPVMGDVLTGLIGALLSQGMSAVEAGAVGAYVHGLAGDDGAQQGKRGLVATDCLQALQRILQ